MNNYFERGGMKKPEMQIAGRKIGYHYNPIVLAEIGINHEGILQTAIEMVEAAISAGAEIIKHQTHVVEDEMSDAAKNTIPGNSPDSIYDIMDRCSLNEEEEWKLKRYTESRGAIFISTPFSRAAVDRLVKFEVPAFKIGSGECNNYPLLDYICSFRKPIILSTGMNNLVSVRKAVQIIRKHKIPFALLHTTNLYPTPPELVRLGSLVDLQKAFPDAVIGLSDHTTNNLACLGAVALGASILERHFTDSKDRKGPDIVCSMTPDELNELIASSKVLKLERGGSKKSLLREEEVTRNFAFATVVTIKPVKEGEIFSKENLWVKRPGTGKISAAEFHNVIGKRAARDIMTNVHLDWSDIR
jgi:N-acetylneuraminate synthase